MCFRYRCAQTTQFLILSFRYAPLACITRTCPGDDHKIRKMPTWQWSSVDHQSKNICSSRNKSKISESYDGNTMLIKQPMKTVIALVVLANLQNTQHLTTGEAYSIWNLLLRDWRHQLGWVVVLTFVHQ